MSTSDCPFTESSGPAPGFGRRRTQAGWILLVLILAGGWACTKPPAPSLSPTEGYSTMARGIGLLEQYDYAGAYKLFSSLCESFPGWEAAWVNRGIAGLNLQDESKCIPNMKKALELNPGNPHALLVLGIQYKHIRRMDEALDLFSKVIARDPEDPHGHYYVGEILAERDDREGAVSHLRRALQLQPSFASAWYRLANLHRRKDQELRTGMLNEFKRLKGAGAGILVGSKYGEGGRYSLAIRDSFPPGYSSPPAPELRTPAIGAAREISGLAKPAQAPAGDLAAGMALGDLDGDGSLELVLCGSPPPGGAGQSSLAVFNYSVAGGYSPGRRLPFDARLCCLVDLDGDTDLDLVAADSGSFRFLVNDGKGGLEETSPALKLERDGGFPLRLYALDVDSDWDLDIICLRQWKEADGTITSRVQVLNNDRTDPGGFGGFSEITTACGLKDFDLALVELAVVDLDGDVDLDLAVFDRQGVARFFSNHRAWKFSEVEQAGKPSVPGIVSVSSGDLDGDGDEDLVAFCGDRLRLLRNDGLLRFATDEDFEGRYGALGGTGGSIFDFDGDMAPELLVADARAAGESIGAAVVSPGEKPARYALRSEP
ncbi:MAG: FG-GAP-like repeat-containing protein, partial [Planctomycetota bacterium]|nr:FG-GAP-like repeat-containing protein [Planctomycetota bacterium]